ncbi:hypothetical protein HS048_18525 [Planomonospora sp. ID91781]|uniref:Uncharacterized protein n=3 Tax=Planomonospora TaxID=1998 RepID=A0A171DNS1_9ACTN|nr:MULTISPECIES: hypothetical protein [Planomonospora]MBG0822734.1 hypothetical protein [Planomonospora sp. ID91781]GAT70705.1 hypothetical protein PS9374_06391 [Planomonospora sphaerica]GGK92984.1 hypothetical protein GCM10010126_60330 [Planomonospora parontospora]GII12091.1 hypothetical protein Ppa06_58890 [Planomonospora parontospora subsp. parontospora]
MYLINARLRAPEEDGSRPPPPPRMPVRELRDLVLALADPADRIEHVYGAVSAAGADLGLFVLQPTLEAAETAAERLCRRCLATSPRLAGWSLDGCAAGLVPCLAEALLLGGGPGSVLPLQGADRRRGLSRN